MDITNRLDGDVAIFQLNGRIDAATAPGVEHAVNTAVDGGAKRVILDMSGVAYVSSAGLRAILLAARKASSAKGGMAVFGLQAPVAQVFNVSGFGKIVPIAASEAEARQKLGI
jgi:anti-anti-sigma factor